MEQKEKDPKGVLGQVYAKIHTSYGWPTIDDLKVDQAVSSLPGDRKPYGEDGIYFTGSTSGYIRMQSGNLYMYEPKVAVDRETGSMHLIGQASADFDCNDFVAFAKSDPDVLEAVEDWRRGFGSYLARERFPVVLDTLGRCLAHYLQSVLERSETN